MGTSSSGQVDQMMINYIEGDMVRVTSSLIFRDSLNFRTGDNDKLVLSNNIIQPSARYELNPSEWKTNDFTVRCTVVISINSTRFSNDVSVARSLCSRSASHFITYRPIYREFVTDWQRQLVFDVVRKQPDEKPDETQTTPSNSTGIQDLTEEPDKPSPGTTTYCVGISITV